MKNGDISYLAFWTRGRTPHKYHRGNRKGTPRN